MTGTQTWATLLMAQRNTLINQTLYLRLNSIVRFGSGVTVISSYRRFRLWNLNAKP